MPTPRKIKFSHRRPLTESRKATHRKNWTPARARKVAAARALYNENFRKFGLKKKYGKRSVSPEVIQKRRDALRAHRAAQRLENNLWL